MMTVDRCRPAPTRNKTMRVTDGDVSCFGGLVLRPDHVTGTASALGRVICADAAVAMSRLSPASIDLLILDPPYNLNKTFGTMHFARRGHDDYVAWMQSWFKLLMPVLKSTATVYVCADWFTSTSVFQVLSEHLIVRNRITWEREKGRGAAANWKNCSDDIWFATVGNEFKFNLDSVRLKRRVVAPYRENGKAKDWNAEPDGNFRLTAPSNLWTDITVPFWSMSENTEHPAQKPEKLIAKLVLASSDPGDVVLDPFLGSGTTAAVCEKLGRRFVGVEAVPEYCVLALKRLERARVDRKIQGYEQGIFLERNTLQLQMQSARRARQADFFSHAAK